MATLYFRSLTNSNTNIFRIFKTSTNRIKYLSSKRYYSSAIHYRDWEYRPEILEALRGNKPVISHGLPYPQNLATAVTVIENIVRKNGGIPTTILNGKINVGLSSNGIETLVQRNSRDLAYDTTQGLTGATAVPGSMFMAYYAYVKTLVTGIGGVHEHSMDVSADLVELERIPIVTMCAGVKSNLSNEKILEYLEPQGISVLTFGKTTDFPVFFTSKSGIENSRINEECFALMKANTRLHLNSGMVIIIPVLSKETSENNMPPFLLKGISELTKEGSLKSNIALIKNNTKIGSQVSKYLCGLSNFKLESKGTFKSKAPSFFLPEHKESSELLTSNQELMIVGGTAIDITSTLDPLIISKSAPYFSTSSPGTVRQSTGGVGRNIAETSFRLGANPLLISAIGNDLNGNWLQNKFEKIGMKTNGLQIINNESTAVYNAIHDPNGNLVCAVADMKIFDSLSSDKIIQTIKESKPKLVCFDGNISVECIYSILNTCNTYNIPTFFETTSISKSLKLFEDPKQFTLLLSSQSLKYISPNSFELETMYSESHQKGFFDFDSNAEWFEKIDGFGLGPKFRNDVENLSKRNPTIKDLVNSGLFVQTIHFLPYIPNIIVKLGENGILLAQYLKELNINDSNEILKDDSKNEIIIKGRDGKSGLRFRYFKPIKFDKNEIINVTGAGDSVVGTLVSGLILHDETKIDEIIEVAQRIALMTLKSHNSVSENINKELLEF